MGQNPSCVQKQITGKGPIKEPFQPGQVGRNPSWVQKQVNPSKGPMQASNPIPTVTVSSTPANHFKPSPRSATSCTVEHVQFPVEGRVSTSPTGIGMVSSIPPCRSHSPCRRIDVELDSENQSGHGKLAQSFDSQENLWASLEFEDDEQYNPFSQSCPSHLVFGKLKNANSHHELFSSHSPPSVYPRRSSCVSDNAIVNFLQVPQFSPRTNSSTGINNLMRCRSSEQVNRASQRSPVAWLGLSPRTSPQPSRLHSPTSPKSHKGSGQSCNQQ